MHAPRHYSAGLNSIPRELVYLLEAGNVPKTWNWDHIFIKICLCWQNIYEKFITKIIIHVHINGILFLSVHVGITVIALKCSKELLRLSCCSPLASSLRKYLLDYIHQYSILETLDFLVLFSMCLMVKHDFLILTSHS